MAKTFTAMALIAGLIGWGDPARAYDVVGVGTWSCAAWTEARKNVRSDTAEQWTLGFLTGIGFIVHAGDPLKGQPPQLVSEWLDRYCHSNPKETIAHATEKFSASRQIFAAPAVSESIAAPAGNR